MIMWTYIHHMIRPRTLISSNRLHKALMGFDWSKILRLIWNAWCSTSHPRYFDEWWDNFGTFSIWPGNIVPYLVCLCIVVYNVFFIFIFLGFYVAKAPFSYCRHCMTLVRWRRSYVSKIIVKEKRENFFEQVKKIFCFLWFWEIGLFWLTLFPCNLVFSYI